MNIRAVNDALRDRRIVCIISAIVCCLLCTAAWSDTIELVSGQSLQGDVLKESSEAVFIDVGVDVLRIPQSRIKSRTSTQAIAPKPAETDKGEIYSTARLPVRSVKELAAEYGEGVVLVQTPAGLGSGFLISEQGYCVTNYHVIEQETQIAATIFQRGTHELVRRRIDDVRIVALNPFFDLALLQLPRPPELKFHPVQLASDDDQKEGDLVFAIGNPLGLERSVSQGIVSTRNRNLGGLVYVQTTTQINPGNSGGPLFNARGEVVGVTNMKIAFGEGLGFAIPVAYLKHFLDYRDAFAYDKNSPNTGFRYLEAPRRRDPGPAPVK